MALYFAYGSNLDRVQMARRCPGSRPLYRAELEQHRLAFTGAQRGVATVRRDPWSVTPGVIYSVTRADLQALDGYEGHPWCYTRAEMALVLEDGRMALAWVYVKRDTSPHEPQATYLQIIKAAYHRLAFDLRTLKDAVEEAVGI
tara:strand:+ start:551 stop:982 length:432 start_codon:yes stop_codon:yes gene_type:complete